MMQEPTGLGDRGSRLFRELTTGHTDPVLLEMATEAARLADRLDELDSIIQGKGVLNLMQFRLHFPEAEDQPYEVEVKFQNVFSEARQQQNTYRQILVDITKLKAAAKATDAPKAGPSAHPAGIEDELARRRREREARRKG